MSESAASIFASRWRTRFTLVLLCFGATFVMYIDRVNISVAIIPMADIYGWDVATQGMILSSFYVGYMLMQIGGGRLADRYGGKVVLGAGVLLWSFFTLITPPAAALGLTVLIIARVCMGLGEAVTLPSIFSMISRWFPKEERSKAIAFSVSGISFGTMIGLAITPYIVLYMGWEWCFYLFAVVGVIWFIFWQPLISTDPNKHPRISANELSYINENVAVNATDGPQDTPPITHFLKNKAMWAITVAHFCSAWTLYVILSWLPKYVNEGLGVTFALIGIVSIMPHVVSIISLNVFGNIADRMIRSGMDVTFVRKFMQCTSFGGLALCLIGITFVDAVWSAMTLLCLGKVFNSMNVGGYNSNHMDIGPRHAGTLMGITNTAGTIPGIVGVYISGLILQITGSWDYVFLTAAGVTLFGMVFYLLFASGEKQFD